MRRRIPVVLIVVAVFAVFLGWLRPAIWPGSERAAAVEPAYCGFRSQPPKRFKHVIWLWMENRGYHQIIGNTLAPFENQLANKCGVATNYYGLVHPSLPNYIAATSGSTFGIEDSDGPEKHPLKARSIFHQVRSWRAYQESMPEKCFLENTPNYAVRHNPATYYTSLRRQCAKNDVVMGTTMSGRFISDLEKRKLPSFSFVAPNMCNNMHDCPISAGDKWLSRWIPAIVRSRSYRAGDTVLFITWDEDDYHGTNRVATFVVSPYTKPGTRVGAKFDHYSLLRTTEELLGIRKYLRNAKHANSMRKKFNLRP